MVVTQVNMKIFHENQINLDDNFPLSKILKLHNLTIVGRSVLQKANKYYAQVFSTNVCMNCKY